jgi:spermidine synthase
MLGGGAYSYPKNFIETNKTGFMDVVEIDPGLTDLARKYFALKENPRLGLINEDARVYLNKSDKKYDVIFVDVFTATLSIPFHVITKETIEKEFRLLNDDGAVLINVISAIEGNKSKYFRAFLATYRKVFPHVYVFPINVPENGNIVQNIMVVALKTPTAIPFISSNAEIQSYLSHLWTKEIPQDTGIFTDDFAPVEKYAEEML